MMKITKANNLTAFKGISVSNTEELAPYKEDLEDMYKFKFKNISFDTFVYSGFDENQRPSIVIGSQIFDKTGQAKRINDFVPILDIKSADNLFSLICVNVKRSISELIYKP